MTEEFRFGSGNGLKHPLLQAFPDREPEGRHPFRQRGVGSPE
ncbi:hypothetical protein [Pelobacter propionicus]|nr:hypothetical protein [Pelobacter propionicus]